ncbi:hypothetical protein GCM10010495_77460 [Kitasatospora herbaricolor]|nr:hypothetical protein GCM10010495_77460 [Kitasatospora herbaricolor]
MSSSWNYGQAPRSRARIFTFPPDDSLTTAAITIADKFLQARDEVEAATYLQPLVDEAATINHAVSYPSADKSAPPSPLQVVLCPRTSGSGSGKNFVAEDRHGSMGAQPPRWWQASILQRPKGNGDLGRRGLS